MSKHGDAIRRERQRKKMTMKELALKTGLSESYIHVIETGKQTGSLNALSRIAAILGLNEKLLLVTAKLVGFDSKSFDELGLVLYEEAFSKLNPEIKRLLLKIAPLLEEYLESET